jgi:hypothetical protein
LHRKGEREKEIEEEIPKDNIVSKRKMCRMGGDTNRAAIMKAQKTRKYRSFR